MKSKKIIFNIVLYTSFLGSLFCSHVWACGDVEDQLLFRVDPPGDVTFSKDDPKAAVATMADDADYWLNVGGGPAAKGKKDLTKGLTAWFKSFPDQQWTTVNAWGVDGFAIVEHTMSGTNKGAIGPIPPTGKPVQNWHWLDIMQPTADGKVQHGWGYANFTEAFPPPMAK